MRTRVEEKILRKLDKIEGLLTQIIPSKTELTEEDVLEIIKEGRREYKEGKTKEFDTLINEKYPHLIKKKMMYAGDKN
ncbi:MAG TPA: hypothetical protein VJK26_03465 [Patescibacteria group bacterium]|nr:hypothetical protein [Patescibacteria group bacterium]